MSVFGRIALGEHACAVAAALEFATDEYPLLDLSSFVVQVETWSDQLLDRLDEADSLDAKLDQLNHFFFRELGFRGNVDNYYDPRNSYLNDVIERRLGIPISLSLLYRRLARVVGVSLHGVNVPGHFMLVAETGDRGRLYIDVFGGGVRRDWDACRLFLRRRFGMTDELEEAELEPLDDRLILVRMLRNLKSIYSHRDFARCLQVQRRIVQLLPGDAGEIRDLGILHFHNGQPMLAMHVLDGLMRSNPEFEEDPLISAYLSKATREAVRMN